jgi:prepilin-type N-terminal cleavage/methylation domain-containing protein
MVRNTTHESRVSVLWPICRGKGFTLLELIMVVAIILIVAAIAAANVTRAIRTARIRGAAVEYANLLQTTHTRAINDDRFYAVYVQPPVGGNTPVAYADLYPLALNGRSGLGPPPTGHYNPGPPADPMTTLSSRVAAAGRFGSRCEQPQCCVLRLVHARSHIEQRPDMGTGWHALLVKGFA